MTINTNTDSCLCYFSFDGRCSLKVVLESFNRWIKNVVSDTIRMCFSPYPTVSNTRKHYYRTWQHCSNTLVFFYQGGNASNGRNVHSTSEDDMVDITPGLQQAAETTPTNHGTFQLYEHAGRNSAASANCKYFAIFCPRLHIYQVSL